MGVAPGLATLPSIERVAELAGRAARACVADVRARLGVLGARGGLAVSVSPEELVGAADLPALGQSLARTLELSKSTPLEIALDAAGSFGDRLATAVGWITRGEVDWALVGGVHSDHGAERIAALAARGALFTPEAADAPFPGEQAAFVALGKRAPAPFTELVTSSSVEGPREGAKAWDVTVDLLRAALPEEALAPSLGGRMGWIFSDLAFDASAFREEGALLTRAQRYFEAPFFLDHPAQRIGALGAATVPLGLACVSTSFRVGLVPSRAALVLGTNERGRRSLAVVRLVDA
jgi:3-oxoacyl-[acyl-carrier-protein] synthase-1